MKRRTKSTNSFRVGPVTLRDLGSGQWQFRFSHPLSRRDVRLKEVDLTRDDAELRAGVLYEKAKSEEIPSEPVQVENNTFPTIKQAFRDSIRLSNQRPYVRKNSAQRAGRFVEWLMEKYPGVKTWDQLKPGIVREYIQEEQARGLAFNTVRLNMAPIRLAWNHVQENFPDEIRDFPKIKLKREARREVQCLSMEEFSRYLDWLEVRAKDEDPKKKDSWRNYRDLWPIVALQGLCGLRMLEAAALRAQDVDPENWTITITETDYHTPKTEGSYRTLPVCSEVMRILQEHVNRKPIPESGELFLNQSMKVWGPTGLSRRLGIVRNEAADALGLPRLKETQPHSLRATFATSVSRLGIPDSIVKRYLGHVGEGILGKHYREILCEELRVVSDRFEQWRTLKNPAKARNILAPMFGAGGSRKVEEIENARLKAL